MYEDMLLQSRGRAGSGATPNNFKPTHSSAVMRWAQKPQSLKRRIVQGFPHLLGSEPLGDAWVMFSSFGRQPWSLLPAATSLQQVAPWWQVKQVLWSGRENQEVAHASAGGSPICNEPDGDSQLHAAASQIWEHNRKERERNKLCKGLNKGRAVAASSPWKVTQDDGPEQEGGVPSLQERDSVSKPKQQPHPVVPQLHRAVPGTLESKDVHSSSHAAGLLRVKQAAPGTGED